MTSLRAELQRVARSFELVSEGRFRLLGRYYSVDETRPRSGKLLSDQLYLTLHCKNPDVVGGTILPRHAGANPRDFFSSLAARNRGSGSWRGGWSISRVNEGQVTVTSHELEVWASPEEFQPVTGKHERGGAGRLRFPNEYRGMSRGYYVALGNNDADTGPDSVRVYWNITASGAGQLLERITGSLNDAGVTFRFKSMGDPEGYDRTDAAVLYLPRGDWDSVAPLVSAVYDAVRPWMRANVSSYVFELAPGLGLAEEPGGDLSFGEHRSELIAEALLSAHGLPDVFGGVQSAIADLGHDLDRFFLNPGSARQYAPLWP